MKIDDSFKKPGSVPFKWEIRPGVPKLPTTQTQPGREPGSEKHHQRKQKQKPMNIHNHPFLETPQKLKPPPAGLFFHPPMEPRTRTRARSVESSPRALSNRFGHTGLARPDVVSSAGCFPSPIGKLKNSKNRGGYPRSVPEPEYYSDLEISPRWSVSSRKSVSSFFPSSSPRPVSDLEWAGFGLF